MGNRPPCAHSLVHGAAADPARAPRAPLPLSKRLDRLALLASGPADTEDERERKGAFVLTTMLIALASFVWIGTYLALDLIVAAAIPFAYQGLTAVTIAALAATKRYDLFRAVHLTLWLLLPFLLQWTLGGFVDGSAVAMWALVAPLGALVFHGPRAAVGWFAAFAALLVVSAALESALPDRSGETPGWLAAAFFALNLAAPSLTAFAILERFLVLLEAERDRSERLLLNILPPSTAERLKRSVGVIADRSEEVSVLFADLTGFTSAAERLPPERVVALLDEIFSAFDELVEAQGAEKIKTLGDGYMVAAGIPVPRPDHAAAVADLALAMRRRLDELPAAAGFRLRVGVDSGPVVAGVIGRSKFSYDLWGDTVNTASRMQAHAPPGGIQVTERTHALLRDAYRFAPPTLVDVKGKGTLATYLLLGHAPGPPP